MIPTIAELGPFPIHSFGFMMVLCFAAGWRQLALALESVGESSQLAEDMITWAAIGGVLGARIFYILSFPEHFLKDPIGAIFGGAGFVFYGGFFGGAFACWVLLRRRGKPFLKMSDLTAPSLAIAYAVGRIGCQLSGDGDYGQSSSVPWAVSYVLGVYPTDAGVLVHPTPVYETFAALTIAWFLLKLRRNARFPLAGQLFGCYLLLSAFARFLVEYLRIEPVVLGSLTQAQVESIVVGIAGVFFLSGIPAKGTKTFSPNACSSQPET